MTQRTFTTIAGFVYLLIAFLHALRLIFGWEAVIAGWRVPHSLSWIAIGLFGTLAYLAFQLRRSGR